MLQPKFILFLFYPFLRLQFTLVAAFEPVARTSRIHGHSSLPQFMAHEDYLTDTADFPDNNEAGKFKILTCSSTACAAKRKAFNMDPYTTFAAFYTRIQDQYPLMKIEECPCLGACKEAPCVGIEHDDFDGPVSLEGMHPNEFAQRVFQKITFEEDVDRVWSSVENAIQTIMTD